MRYWSKVKHLLEESKQSYCLPLLYRREIVQEFLYRIPRFKVIEQILYRHTRTCEYGLAALYVR